jgi:DnaJ-class molecular chaperone
MNYRTYDPSTEGFGGTRQWRGAFTSAMGLDEAQRRVGVDSPHAILGLGACYTEHELKSAYRARALACHPDRAVDLGRTVADLTEQFKRLTAAYTILAARFAARRRT